MIARLRAHTMFEQGAAWMIFLGVRLHISYAYFISSRDQRCSRQGVRRMGVAWIHLLVPCAPPSSDSVNACGAAGFRGQLIL